MAILSLLFFLPNSGHCTFWICVLVLQWIWLPIFPCSIWWGKMRFNSWVAWEFTLLHYFSENIETFFQLEIFFGNLWGYPIAMMIHHMYFAKIRKEYFHFCFLSFSPPPWTPFALQTINPEHSTWVWDRNGLTTWQSKPPPFIFKSGSQKLCHSCLFHTSTGFPSSYYNSR